MVSGLTGVVAVSAGYSHTCAVLNDGTARCWGSGSDGELGDGAGAASSTPVVVAGSVPWVSIAAGGYHSCARHADGTGECWGFNGSGELGNGTTAGSTVPVVVTNLQ